MSAVNQEIGAENSKPDTTQFGKGKYCFSCGYNFQHLEGYKRTRDPDTAYL